MTFQAHRDEILKFYDSTNTIVHEHQETYGKLVIKLNQKESATQLLNGNLDDFMAHSFSEFNAFRARIQSQKLDDSTIQFTYDSNKKDYLNSFSLPEKNIIVKHKFILVKIGGTDVVHKLNTLGPCPNMNISKPPSTSFKNRDYICGKGEVIETIGVNPIVKTCACPHWCGCAVKVESINHMWVHSEIYKSKEQKTIEFWIDDYLNIYIPSLKTYLVFNYSKIPLYAFFMNRDVLGMYNHLESGAIQFNEAHAGDLAEYNSIKSFVDSFDKYLTSKDTRNTFKTLFPNLAEFYKYDSKHKFFAQFQTLSEKLEHLAPSATRNSIVTNEDNTGMSDEHKLFAQSQRIRELEIQASKNEEELAVLRSERTQQIEVISEQHKNKLSTNSLLEELNTQLHEEIDRSSIHQKKVVTLKTKILEYNELTNKFRNLEDSKQKLIVSMNDMEQELMEVKTLNNSLVDKQVEACQKLDMERSIKLEELEQLKELRLSIDVKDKELSNMALLLDSESKLHEYSKTKLEQMFASIQTSKFITDDYPKLLLKQIQDKNSQIEQLKLDKSSLEVKSNSVNKQLSQLKLKVSSLIS